MGALTGKVIWQYQRRRPEDAVRKLSGVTGVTNSISIKSTADVSDNIEDASTLHAQAIRVTVREGNKASLEGGVGSWDEREAVEIAAWSAAGVQSVDRLTIVR
jgi:osmotically-inducible protein OsmY